MAINSVLPIFRFINSNKIYIRRTLLILAFASLFINRKSYNLSSKESLFDQLGLSTALLFDVKEIEYDDNPPHETIMVCIDGDSDFENILTSYIKRIKIRGKSIIFENKDVKENYFLKIFIKKSNKSNIVINPLKKFQPNTDIHYLALKIFEPKTEYRLLDTLNNNIENRIQINLQMNEIEKFCILLRLYMNIESYMYGGYYYIPIGRMIISAESLYIFIILTLTISSLECNIDYNAFYICLIAVLYNYFPFICLLFLSKKYCLLFGLIFSTLNFRFAFLYSLIIYSIFLKYEIQLLLKRYM